jgi:hypothetical protein
MFVCQQDAGEAHGSCRRTELALEPTKKGGCFVRVAETIEGYQPKPPQAFSRRAFRLLKRVN